MTEALTESLADRRTRLEQSRRVFDGTEAQVLRVGDQYVHDLGGFTINSTGLLNAGDGITTPAGMTPSRAIMSAERYASLLQDTTAIAQI